MGPVTNTDTTTPATPTLACPWPGCGGTVTRVSVCYSGLRHHERSVLEGGGWVSWDETDQPDWDDSHFVTCTESDPDWHQYYPPRNAVPEVIAKIVAEATYDPED